MQFCPYGKVLLNSHRKSRSLLHVYFTLLMDIVIRNWREHCHKLDSVEILFPNLREKSKPKRRRLKETTYIGMCTCLLCRWSWSRWFVIVYDRWHDDNDIPRLMRFLNMKGKGKKCNILANLAAMFMLVYHRKSGSIGKLGTFFLHTYHNTRQECIPVGCVPPSLYHKGASLDTDPLDRDPPGQKSPVMWPVMHVVTETPPPSPWTESQTGVKTLPSHNFVCGR